MLFSKHIIGLFYFRRLNILRYAHLLELYFAIVIYFIGNTKYLGLGVPMIVESFSKPANIMIF
jgi:hypothetical protein